MIWQRLGWDWEDIAEVVLLIWCVFWALITGVISTLMVFGVVG